MFTKISKIISIVSVLFISCSGLVFAQTLPDSREFESQCWQDGAVDYINEITREWDDPRWEGILNKIRSGDEGWVRASSCIGTTNAYSNQTLWTDLNGTWAEALPEHPQVILGLSILGVPLNRICSFRIIEPEREWAAQYVKDTLAALEAIPDDATMWNIPLAIERDVCILRLKDAYAKKYDYAD